MERLNFDHTAHEFTPILTDLVDEQGNEDHVDRYYLRTEDLPENF